jgi:serine/threonine protein phosphatase 1
VAGVHFLDARGPEGMRLYAIGDVHGRLDLLRAMHAQIRSEIMRDRPSDWRIIHVGDYVDRGPDSKGVLDFLIARVAEDERVQALGGNHDAGFLDFLARPDPLGLFMRFGGIQTARSYGVRLVDQIPGLSIVDEDAIRAGHAALLAAVPEAHLRFLHALPRTATFGDFFFCHAGIRPGVPLDRQDPEDLIWIRDTFLNWPELHPKVIVHGHTPCETAEVLANRVNIDTLAYTSGRLTALVVDGAGKRLLEA